MMILGLIIGFIFIYFILGFIITPFLYIYFGTHADKAHIKRIANGTEHLTESDWATFTFWIFVLVIEGCGFFWKKWTRFTSNVLSKWIKYVAGERE